MENLEYLQEQAREMRVRTMKCIASLGVGHVGGALSICDVLSALYFDKMIINREDDKDPNRDRIVLSKGHAGPAIYAALNMVGFIDDESLLTLNQGGTKLPSHPDRLLTRGVDMTTGSLGQGYSLACGMAAAAQQDNKSHYVYAILGDGECQEGQIWESASFASSRGLTNLITFLDKNGLSVDGSVHNVSVDTLPERWESFGFDVQSIDGHDITAICEAIDKAKANKEKPSMIVLNTIKGKGFTSIEGSETNHNMPIDATALDKALTEIAQ